MAHGLNKWLYSQKSSRCQVACQLNDHKQGCRSSKQSLIWNWKMEKSIQSIPKRKRRHTQVALSMNSDVCVYVISELTFASWLFSWLFIANWDFALVAAALLYCHPTICSHYLNGLKGRGPAASSTFLGEWLWKKSTFRGTSIKVETIFSDLSLSPNCLKWHAIDFKLILWII